MKADLSVCLGAMSSQTDQTEAHLDLRLRSQEETCSSERRTKICHLIKYETVIPALDLSHLLFGLLLLADCCVL